MLKRDFLQAGDFNVRLGLEAPVSTPDGYGGYEIDWQHQRDVWARIVPIAGIVVHQSGNEGVELTHWIFTRNETGITAGCHLVKGQRRFLVETAQDPDETGRYLVCNVIEQSGETT